MWANAQRDGRPTNFHAVPSMQCSRRSSAGYATLNAAHLKSSFDSGLAARVVFSDASLTTAFYRAQVVSGFATQPLSNILFLTLYSRHS